MAGGHQGDVGLQSHCRPRKPWPSREGHKVAISLVVDIKHSIVSEFLVQVDVLQVTKLTEPVPQPLPRVSSSLVASVFKVKINQSIYLQ